MCRDVNGRQVNDSYIILKNMIPALTGGFNEEWEDKIVNSLQVMYFWHLIDSCKPTESRFWMLLLLLRGGCGGKIDGVTLKINRLE